MNIYVGNLPYSISEEKLKETFSKFGEVVSVKIITNKYTGKSKGFGFVEMASDQDAKNAISEANGQEIEGRSLRVNEAKPKEDSENRGGSFQRK